MHSTYGVMIRPHTNYETQTQQNAYGHSLSKSLFWCRSVDRSEGDQVFKQD